MKRGTNLPRIADYNQGIVLEAIRISDGTSRVEIAESTGLTAQTVSNIVKRLTERGLVIELDRVASGSGKPRVMIRANPDSSYAVGVQIDGDDTSYVLADLTGGVVSRERQLTPQAGPRSVIEQVAGSVERIVDGAGISAEKMLGMGVACPGPLDPVKGVVTRPPNLLGWKEVPLKDRLEEATGYPVLVDNDATASAIGERWFGGAKSTSNFAVIYAGVGIGAGLFIEDHVYRGSTANAGEFGHLSLNPDGPECFCGNRGCVEVYCSPKNLTLSVLRRLENGEPSSLRTKYETNPRSVDFLAVSEAALAGDELAAGEVRNSARLLGYGAVNLVNLLDLEMIVLGGKGFRDLGALYQKDIEYAIRSHSITRQLRKIEVRLSEAGEDAGALGAASLVLHKAYYPQLARLD